jgi:hypothetical protein
LRQILEARSQRYRDTPVVLDVGSSYGINAAVHRFPVSFNVLRRRYTRREVAALTSEELLRLDRHYYASWPDTGLARFVGLDVSAPAIRYAKDVGLIEHGVTTDLETTPLSTADVAALKDVNVILSTGAIGYVTEKTFGAVLGAVKRTPWIVSFVLRMFPYDALAAQFERHGLVTEHLATVMFVQRRFRDAAEFKKNLDLLESRGLDTRGFESDGLLRAELYVSRPAIDVAAAPLEKIVTVCSGRDRPVGARYVQVGTDSRVVALEP